MHIFSFIFYDEEVISLTEHAQTKLFSDKRLEISTADLLKRKQRFKSYTQEQQFLLPKNLNDFVGSGHIARLVSTIIQQMDTAFVTATYKGGGASAYDPKMLLKVWILGFISKTYSSRMLAKHLRENLPFIWISGNQTPDFRTLNNFRLRLKEDIKKIFKQIVIYALENEIIDAKDVFVDHTKREANANKHKVVWKKQVERQLAKIDQELESLFKYVDKINEEEDEIFAGKDLPEQERQRFDQEKVKEIVDKINNQVRENKKTKEKAKEQKEKIRRIKELQEREEQYQTKKQILGERNSFSKTDRDAVAMMMKDKLTVRPAYNEGIAVERGFVLNYVISQNCGDTISFIPLMNGVIDNAGKAPENAHSDGAYGNEETMSYLEKKDIGNFLKYGTYYKEKKRNWKEKNRLEGLTYDKRKDEFTCPSGIKLNFEKEKPEITKTGFVRRIRVYRGEQGHCDRCPFHRSQTKTLSLSWNGERLKQQAKTNLESEKGKELRMRRGNEVESVFGDQKLNKDKKRYNLRGLIKVNLEAGLYYIAHNLRKIHSWNSLTSQRLVLEKRFLVVAISS